MATSGIKKKKMYWLFYSIGNKFLLYFSVKTDIMDDGAMSRLFIANSNQHDSGNYTCSLGDIAHASVAVVVLNGKRIFI